MLIDPSRGSAVTLSHFQIFCKCFISRGQITGTGGIRSELSQFIA